MAIKLEGGRGGGKALMAWSLVEELFFAASLSQPGADLEKVHDGSSFLLVWEPHQQLWNPLLEGSKVFQGFLVSVYVRHFSFFSWGPEGSEVQKYSRDPLGQRVPGTLCGAYIVPWDP